MRLSDLLLRLPASSVSSSALTDPGCDIYSVGFLTSEQDDAFRGDVLYVGDSTMLPAEVPSGRQFSCVVYGGSEPAAPLADHPNANLVWLADDANPYACFNALVHAFIEGQELTGIVNRLVAAHISNRGLQYLVEEAACALGHPIVVVDSSYRYVGYHLGALAEDDSQLSRVIAQEIANETVLDRAVAYIRDQRIDSKLARGKGLYLHYNEILACNTMTSAVMVRGVCIAHVMMMEHGGSFSELDREVLERLTGLVGQELQKSEVWGPTSGEMGSYFLANLLGDRSPSEAVTYRRMKALNFHPKDEFFVACLHAPGEGLSQSQAEQVAAQLQPVLHHSLYTRYHQQLVILFSRREGEGLESHTEPKLREVAALNGLTVGVSNAFDSIVAVRANYDQARSALRYGRLVDHAVEDHGLYHYRDLTAWHLLDLAGRRQNLLALCHPALLGLAAHDEGHGSELMETLFVYLQVAGSTARASQLLNLHKNTLLYRLRRAREVLGMDLASGEELFQLQLGFRILMYLGLFSPRVRMDRSELASP